MDVSHGEPLDQLAGADEADGGAGKSRQKRVVEAAAVAQTEAFAVEGEPGHEGHGTDEVGGMHFTRGVVRGFFHAEGAAHEPVEGFHCIPAHLARARNNARQAHGFPRFPRALDELARIHFRAEAQIGEHRIGRRELRQRRHIPRDRLIDGAPLPWDKPLAHRLELRPHQRLARCCIHRHPLPLASRRGGTCAALPICSRSPLLARGD